jgi:cytoskeletal protein RodZ
MAVFGDTLRQARAYKGVTLREAERATRINRYHLAALEEENFGALPPLIYQRGIVRNYATYLDLDPNKLIELFNEARGEASEPEVGVVVKPLDMPSHWAPNFAIIAFMVVMSAVVFAWLYSAYFAPAEAISTPTEIIATVTPVDSEALILPSPTPKPPTPTPEPSATPTEAPEPTPPPTEEVEQAQPPAVEETAPLETVVEEEEAVDAEPTPPPQTEEGVASIQISASAEIYIEVVADGETVYTGTLFAGQATEWFNAEQFQVYTTDGSNTVFTNGKGDQFYMGYGYDEIYYLTADG